MLVKVGRQLTIVATVQKRIPADAGERPANLRGKSVEVDLTWCLDQVHSPNDGRELVGLCGGQPCSCRVVVGSRWLQDDRSRVLRCGTKGPKEDAVRHDP